MKYTDTYIRRIVETTIKYHVKKRGISISILAFQSLTPGIIKKKT